MDLMNELRSMFPWMDQIGLSPEFFQQLSSEAASSDEIITKLRQQPQYKQRFPGLWRSDGSLRMTEAQYLSTEDAFRQKANQAGIGDQFKNPQSFVGLFDSEQDPTEFGDRLSIYNQLKVSGRETKDAFYVYAGMKISDDQLFEATVDPAASQRLTDEYNQKVAAQKFDYTTWITRATEVGLGRVSAQLAQLQSQGAVTGQAVQTITQTDPNFARQIMDALYTGGGSTATGTLSLNDLMHSFEYAAIGAAATGAGLTLPSKDRIAEIRAAGVDRAKALSAYGQYGQSKGQIGAASERYGLGVFGQNEFEQAQFLGDASKRNQMDSAQAIEQGAGKQQGQFRLEQSQQGGFVQQGLRNQSF
jgi:hypothetical protein